MAEKNANHREHREGTEKCYYHKNCDLCANLCDLCGKNNIRTTGEPERSAQQGEVLEEVQQHEVAVPARTTMQRVAALLHGIWLPRKYVQRLQQTQSVYSAYSETPEVAELQIDSMSVEGDTLLVISSLNNHEGYEFKLWIDDRDSILSLASDVCDWDREDNVFGFYYRVRPDTAMILVAQSTTGKGMHKTEYVRVRKKLYGQDEGEMGYDYFARKTILDRKFTMLDSLKRGMGDVYFDAESGSTAGQRYAHYNVFTDCMLTDFEQEPTLYMGNKVALCILEKDWITADYFFLKKQRDTMYLWGVDRDTVDTQVEVRREQPTYYLVAKETR